MSLSIHILTNVNISSCLCAEDYYPAMEPNQMDCWSSAWESFSGSIIPVVTEI